MTAWDSHSWQDLAVIGTVLAIGTSVIASVRYLYNKGKIDGTKEKSLEDKIKYLELKYQDLSEEHGLLIEDIRQYRKEQREINQKLLDGQSEIREGIAFIKGKMEGKKKGTNSTETIN